MKTLSLKFTVASIVLAMMVSLAGCGAKSGSAGDKDAFSTDSVLWSDSITEGDCFGRVSIGGQYPAGGSSAVADSIRLWLMHNLAQTDSPDGSGLRPVSSADDADQVVSAYGKELLDWFRSDLKDLSADDIQTNYEYEAGFSPTFISDSLVSYVFTRYIYLGGAHGGFCYYARSSNRNTGAALTFDSILLPGKEAELVALIREGLASQYFESEDGEPSMQDMLLIDPAELPLPVCLPEFTEKGMVITYQQYEIACYAAGLPSCTLPYQAVKPLLNEATLSLLPE